MKCQLDLANGWTVNISDRDMPSVICTIAAWPTHETHLYTSPLAFDCVHWFQFKGGDKYDLRCFSIVDVQIALAEINEAPPPLRFKGEKK